uniref:Uncharacterized protein n=1 Tax=Fagus sylvatica TaxID=28930 RepID=A0A2N9J696_FAGSY
MLPANREFHVVAGVVIFPTHPELARQLAASRKDSVREAPDVGFRRSWYRWKACVAYFCKVPYLRESELGLVRYGPANRGHRSVFGPLEDFFPIGIPARPGKFLAIREFHVVHGCVFFPTCPGLQINLLRVRKTLRASVATSVGKFWNFQHGLISSALHRGELGFVRYDLANRGRRNVPYAKGFDHNSLVSRPFLARKVSNRSSHHVLQNGQGAVSSIQLSVWSTVRSNLGQTWSNLGQPWSNLVEFGQSSPKSGKCIPDHVLRIFSSDLALRKSVRPSEFRNPESKHVAGDLAWVMTQVSNRVIQQSGDPESKHVGVNLAWVTTQVSNWYEVYLAFLALGLPVALSCRCLTEAVVAEIVAGPHALDSCECMNIEGQILRKT